MSSCLHLFLESPEFFFIQLIRIIFLFLCICDNLFLPFFLLNLNNIYHPPYFLFLWLPLLLAIKFSLIYFDVLIFCLSRIVVIFNLLFVAKYIFITGSISPAELFHRILQIFQAFSSFSFYNFILYIIHTERLHEESYQTPYYSLSSCCKLVREANWEGI